MYNVKKKRLFNYILIVLFIIAISKMSFTVRALNVQIPFFSTPVNERNVVTMLEISVDQHTIADDGIDKAIFTPTFYNKYGERLDSPNTDIYYFVNNILTQSNEYVSTKSGTYTITAQAGSVASNPVKITVSPKYTVTIFANKEGIIADGEESVVLNTQITDKNGKLVDLPDGLKYTVSGPRGTYETTSNEFSSILFGYYYFSVQFENYKSNTIMISANDYSRVEISASSSQVVFGNKEPITFSARVYDMYNKMKTGYSTPVYYVNGNKITGSSFTPSEIGEYSVYAVSNNVKSNTLTVSVIPIPLEANPGHDIYTYKTFKVTLDGSKSTSPDNNAITYKWRLVQKPLGSKIVLNNTASVNPDITPDMTGDYIVGLIVDDGTNVSEEKTIEVRVKNFSDTTDEIDSKTIGTGGSFSGGYNFLDMIPLTNGWVIAKNTGQNKVGFMNVLTGEIVKEYDVDDTPHKMLFDFDREILFVSFLSMNKIAVVDIITGDIKYINIEV
ncbi:MAG: PKD domain-containing protein [Bacillota bacterium]